MAFELTVSCERPIPDDLGQQWPLLLSSHGIDCEVDPTFSPRDWNGGFLPIKVNAIPRELIDGELQSPAISGFEVDFEGNAAFFRSAMGRTCTEFALLCLCAAELANACNGHYHDPQAGRSCHGDAARQAALAEIKATLEFEGAAHRVQYPFDGWH